jgi:predicted nucleotidyltransferase
MIEVEANLAAFGTSDALTGICRRFHVHRLDLFGSAATGRGFDPGRSDLDILVTFQELGSARYADVYFGLHEALEALSGRPVDLIAASAIKNPYLRRRVESERRLLFEAP